jgi:hypothetical protein
MTLNGYGRTLLARDNPDALQYVMRAKTLVESLSGGRRFFLLQEMAGEPAPTSVARTVVVERK